MKYVLIWWTLSNPTTFQMQEFGDKQACEEAGKFIAPDFESKLAFSQGDMYTQTRYKCVPYEMEGVKDETTNSKM